MLRKKSSLVLFFIDVDDLKTINDTLGDEERDLALEGCRWRPARLLQQERPDQQVWRR